jgi:Zn-finger protein
MGTFAETEIDDYRLSLANQGKLPFSVSVFSKQTEECRFRCLFDNGSCRFPLIPFSVCSRESTEVDFRNSAEGRIFTELVITSRNSTKFGVQNSAEWTWTCN